MRKEDRKSRRSMAKKKLLVPEDGEDWKTAQIEETTLAIDVARVDAFYRIAKNQLASYCRQNSISDAECQRIADRINYEHSEKNHLRNPKKLKSVADVILDRAREKVMRERAKATDEEFAKLQEKARGELNPPVEEWRMLERGEICQGSDEQTMYYKDGFWPLCPTNIGTILSNPKVKVRRRITP